VKRIRVIIVDESQDTREKLGRLLKFEQDIEVIGYAESGLEALAMRKKVSLM